MSELDLNAPSGAPVATPAAPAPATSDSALVLAPPAAVVVVEPEQAAGSLPVADEKKTELEQRAQAFANEVSALDTRSPEFTQKVDSITSMGDKDMRESARV